jgi:hypothetical protein
MGSLIDDGGMVGRQDGVRYYLVSGRMVKMGLWE